MSKQKEYKYDAVWVFAGSVVDSPVLLTAIFADMGISIEWIESTHFEDDCQTFIGYPYKKMYLDPYTLEMY